MGIIEFSQREILKGKVVKPGFYLVEIDKVSESPSKDGASINYRIDEATILEDEGGDKEFAGVPTPYWNYNSKNPRFMIPFFEAITGEKIEAGTRIGWGSQLQGKKLYVFIDNDKFEGRPVNRIKDDYKPYKG